MTYNYVVGSGNTVYHIAKEGRIYSICRQRLPSNQRIYPEPPPGLKECKRCAKLWREQNPAATENTTQPADAAIVGDD